VPHGDSLHRDMPLGFHWDGVVICTQATFGDVVIALLAFWAVVATARSREWIIQPTFLQSTMFVAVGVAITVVMEALATGPLERWAYTDSMPVLPVLGTGLFPLLQWIVLPPLVIWFVRRQLT
jgi:hypothetical protein